MQPPWPTSRSARQPLDRLFEKNGQTLGELCEKLATTRQAVTKHLKILEDTIRTTPEKLWQALIDPEFTKKYWIETWQESEWKKGSAWKTMTPSGKVADSGEVVKIDPPKKLVLKWQHHLTPGVDSEEFSRMTYTLEPQGEAVKFTVLHEIDVPNSKLIGAVSNGWPHILASLKSLLETGESLEATRHWPKGK